MVDKFELKKSGGEWLAAARSWMQWNCRNGDRVIWGSDEELHGKRRAHLTVVDVEDLAAEVAAAAINEHMKKVHVDERIAKVLRVVKSYTRGAK
jgi:hypothetical protein